MRGLRAAILAFALLGSALLIVSEFTTLYTIRTVASSGSVKSVSTGSHDAYALIPIALLAAALAIGVFIAASRPALLAIGILGVISLVIALAGDLPDAKASGLTHNYVLASSSPSTGLYLETLGAIILLLTCGLGFLLLGPPAHRRPEARKPGPPRSDMSAS